MSFEDQLADQSVTLPTNPWARARAIIALFVVLGPAIGCLAGGVSLVAVAMLGGSMPFGAAVSQFLPLSFVADVSNIMLVYALGLMPALVCGGVVAWYEGWRGPVTGFSALLLGVGVGALTYMISEFMGLPNAVYGAIFSMVVCIVPAYLLSRIVRLWGRADPVAQVATPVAKVSA